MDTTTFDAWLKGRLREERPHQSLGPARRATGMGSVYKITSPSGKVYIGITTNFVSARMASHRDSKWSHCTLIRRAINKYGWGAMKVEVVAYVQKEELKSKEIELIASHNSLAPNGYNSTKGGDANPMEEESGKQAIRDSWSRPEVRERHRAGRLRAWQDPAKRDRILDGRKNSVAFAVAAKLKATNEAEQAKKRELKREAKLEGLTPEERERKIRDMNRAREKKRRQAARKKAQAAAHIIDTSPSCRRSAFSEI